MEVKYFKAKKIKILHRAVYYYILKQVPDKFLVRDSDIEEYLKKLLEIEGIEYKHEPWDEFHNIDIVLQNKYDNKVINRKGQISKVFENKLKEQEFEYEYSTEYMYRIVDWKKYLFDLNKLNISKESIIDIDRMGWKGIGNNKFA